jgi:hypothetical protein
MADKTAEAMAKAMGMNLASDEQETTDLSGESGENTQMQETQEEETQEEEIAEETESTETDDQDSSEGQESQESSPDQGEEKRIIPGGETQETDSGTTDFEKLLAERSNGRFNSLADIDKALEEAPQNAFANEQIAKLNEYVKQGGRLEDFVKTQTVDYSAMSQQDLVREHIMMSEGLTAEEADLLLESDYGVAESASEREKQLASIKLKRAANVAQKALIENQQKWSVPLADTKAEQEAITQKWKSDLTTATGKIENLEVALNQTDKFSYKVEQDVKQKIQTALERPQAFFNRYINPDGTENVQKFVEDMIWLEKKEEIVRSAASTTKSQGKKEVIDEIKNPDYKGQNKGGKETSPKTIVEQAANAFFGR